MNEFIKCGNMEIPIVPFLWYKEKDIVLKIAKLIESLKMIGEIQETANKIRTARKVFFLPNLVR